MTSDEGGPKSGADVELAETFARIARVLLVKASLDQTLRRVCDLSVETIDGCDHAGVTWVDRRGVSTRGATDEVPQIVDDIQYEVSEGPCLEALREHVIVHVDDLSVDDRWPRFSARAAAETGVRSMMSFRLHVAEHTLGALNYYSRAARAFDRDADRIGAVFAAHAAVAISASVSAEQSTAAIASRDVIGQAKGILMAREDITDDDAFALLTRASQRLNRKLRDVASDVIHRQPRGQDPTTD